MMTDDDQIFKTNARQLFILREAKNVPVPKKSNLNWPVDYSFIQGDRRESCCLLKVSKHVQHCLYLLIEALNL